MTLNTMAFLPHCEELLMKPAPLPTALSAHLDGARAYARNALKAVHSLLLCACLRAARAIRTNTSHFSKAPRACRKLVLVAILTAMYLRLSTEHACSHQPRTESRILRVASL